MCRNLHYFFFSSRRRHTRCSRDWSSDVCSSDLLLSVHKESYIPRELPEDLRIANKPGELEGVRNDSGIVFTGNRPFVISVMTTYLRRGKNGGGGLHFIPAAG